VNNVSTLPCETWNAYCARSTVELLQKKTPELMPPQLYPPNWPDLNLADNSMYRKYCKRWCTKHESLIWSYQRRHWQMAATMTWSSLAHSVSSRCFSSFRSVMRILYTFSCNTPTRCNQMVSNLANLGVIVELE